MDGPCGWPTGQCPDDNYGLETPAEALAVEEAAAFILWSLTGQRYGLCETVVTPVPVCHCTRPCSHRTCELYLPGPVNEVTQVTLDSAPYSDWVLGADGVLYSSTWWPLDNQGIEVTYLRGFPLPPGASKAVMELARELAAATCKPEACRLPLNIKSRVRNGDQVIFGEVPEGKTNLPLVDLWVTAALKASAPGGVWSPDVSPWVLESTP